MVQTVTLEAQPRDRAGTGAARAARRAGRLPGILYGGKEPPVGLTFDVLELRRVLKDPGYATHLYDIAVGGASHRALVRDVHLDPVSDEPLHIDFLRVSDATTITISVPVQFINEEHSPGIKIGGILNIVRHEVELVCRADAIPDHITVDLTGTRAGESIHISAIALPVGVRPAIIDRDFTVATIAAPSGGATTAGEEAA